MAELVLEQVILLSEALEDDDYAQAERIVERDDLIDDLEKENDNLSQNAILEAVSNRNILGMGDVDNDIVLKKVTHSGLHSLPFGLQGTWNGWETKWSTVLMSFATKLSAKVFLKTKNP